MTDAGDLFACSGGGEPGAVLITSPLRHFGGAHMVHSHQSWRQTLTRVGAVAIALLLAASLTGTARAAALANFEDGQLDGFAALTNTGVKPWSDPAAGPSPANGTVITPASGPLSSKVLELTGNQSFNFGQGPGAALGYDLLANGHRADFLANNTLEFDWEPAPNASSTAGFSQLFNIIMNSQGGGFVNVDGYSQNGTGTPPADKSNFNQFYFTGYNGNLHHIV